MCTVKQNLQPNPTASQHQRCSGSTSTEFCKSAVNQSNYEAKVPSGIPTLSGGHHILPDGYLCVNIQRIPLLKTLVPAWKLHQKQEFPALHISVLNWKLSLQESMLWRKLSPAVLCYVLHCSHTVPLPVKLFCEILGLDTHWVPSSHRDRLHSWFLLVATQMFSPQLVKVVTQGCSGGLEQAIFRWILFGHPPFRSDLMPLTTTLESKYYFLLLQLGRLEPRGIDLLKAN